MQVYSNGEEVKLDDYVRVIDAKDPSFGMEGTVTDEGKFSDTTVRVQLIDGQTRFEPSQLAPGSLNPRLQRVWYSYKHNSHLQMVGLENPSSTLIGTNNTILLLNGERVRYTMLGDLNLAEPFKGALKTFPDYKLLGVGDWDTVKEPGKIF